MHGAESRKPKAEGKRQKADGIRVQPRPETQNPKPETQSDSIRLYPTTLGNMKPQMHTDEHRWEGSLIRVNSRHSRLISRISFCETNPNEKPSQYLE
jgi:hypothetical protein